MKKGLKIALIVLEIIFIVLSVCAGALALAMAIEIPETDARDPLSAMIMFGYCIFVIVASVQFLLPAASLHALRKSVKSKTNRPVLPAALALISGVIANLLYNTILFWRPYDDANLFLDISVIHYIDRGGLIIWGICIIVCIASLIAVVVKNAKAKRMLKAAESQGDEPKTELGGDVQ